VDSQSLWASQCMRPVPNMTGVSLIQGRCPRYMVSVSTIGMQSVRPRGAGQRGAVRLRLVEDPPHFWIVIILVLTCSECLRGHPI